MLNASLLPAFSTSLSTCFPPVWPFLPLISTPTGFHDWGFVTKLAQLLITFKYCLPRYQSTPREKYLPIEVAESTLKRGITQKGLVSTWIEQKERKGIWMSVATNQKKWIFGGLIPMLRNYGLWQGNSRPTISFKMLENISLKVVKKSI